MANFINLESYEQFRHKRKNLSQKEKTLSQP